MSRIYILSTGRTGTTTLANLLNQIQGSICINHQKNMSRVVNIIGNLYIAKLLPSRTLPFVFPLNKDNSYLKSTADPLLSMAISYIHLQKKFPWKYKIIHLIRDPREFVTSFMNWKNQSCKRKILHHLVPFWQPTPFLLKECSIYDRLKMSKFAHFSWVWNFKNSLFADISKHYSNSFTLKSEDIFSKEVGEIWIQKLLKFIELPEQSFDNKKNSISNPLNKSSKKYFDKWTLWDAKYAHIIDTYCGELMKNFDYGNEEEWMKKLNG